MFLINLTFLIALMATNFVECQNRTSLLTMNLGVSTSGDYVSSLFYSSAGLLYSQLFYGKIKRFDPAAGKLSLKYAQATTNSYAITVDEENGFIYSAYFTTIVKFDIDTADDVAIFTGHTNLIGSLVLDSKGYLYSASWDKVFLLLRAKT
jgi:hypothetical protein